MSNFMKSSTVYAASLCMFARLEAFQLEKSGPMYGVLMKTIKKIPKSTLSASRTGSHF